MTLERLAKTTWVLFCALAAGGFCLLVAGCMVDDGAGGAGGHDDHGAEPVRLMEGLGPMHLSVSTANVEAQRFFDQGLAYVYAFNHEQAVRSFRRAAELDPDLAMARWGEALALGPNINAPEIDREAAVAAAGAARRAVALKQRATEAERMYIDAVALRYPADPPTDLSRLAEDMRGRAVAYSDAMKRLHERYPADLHAATLYAESRMNLRPWKLYTKDGKAEPGTEEIVRALEGVLARDPNHTGANHYYIHAVEASTAPERAMPCAKRLPGLAPAAGHLVHMPAHVYMRTGDYAAAIEANAAAAKADETLFSSGCCGRKQRGPAGFYPMLYYSHNLHFLAVAAAMVGRSREAADAARRLAANVDSAADTNPIADAFGSMPLLLAVRQAQWGDVLKWPVPAESRPAQRAAWHFARGMAHAAAKDVGPAMEEQGKFLALADQKRVAEVPMGNNTAGQVFAIARHLLAGRIAAARGDPAGARAEYQKAVAAQDDLAYDEPPPWPGSARETLGALLLQAGDPTAAEAVFQADLRKLPNNPRSLLGLSEALKARGRQEQAAESNKRFQALWQGGAPPVLADF